MKKWLLYYLVCLLALIAFIAYIFTNDVSNQGHILSLIAIILGCFIGIPMQMKFNKKMKVKNKRG